MMRSFQQSFRHKVSITTIMTTLALGLMLDTTVAGAAQFPSLCRNTESVVFSCKLRSSVKYLSLCGSKYLHGPKAYLVYRFGTFDRYELEYPVDTADSFQKFETSHYFRAQVDRRRVSFRNSGINYEIFSNYEGEQSPPHREGGVTVTMAGKKAGAKTLLCGTPYLDKLEMLDGLVLKGPGYLEDDE